MGLVGVTLMVGVLLGCTGEAHAQASLRSQPLILKDGTVLQAQIRIPAQGLNEPRKFRAFLVFGGFESAASVLTLVPAEFPAVIATFDYPFAGSRKFRFPQTLREAPALRRMVHQTQEGIPLLISALQASPEVAAGRVGLLAGGFATPYVAAAAAQDERIGVVVLVHGFCEIKKTLSHRLASEFERKLPHGLARFFGTLTAGLIQGHFKLPEPEPSLARLRRTQAALLIEATDDPWVPASAREALWQALRRSAARIDRFQMTGGAPDARTIESNP